MSSEAITLLVAAAIGYIVGGAGIAVLRHGEDSDDPWFVRLDSRLSATLAATVGTGLGLVCTVLAVVRA